MALGRTTILPTTFPTDFRTIFRSIPRLCSPTGSPTDSRPGNVSRPVPSHPVNQMPYLPVPFPSRGKQAGTFSHAVPREDPPKNPPAIPYCAMRLRHPAEPCVFFNTINKFPPRGDFRLSLLCPVSPFFIYFLFSDQWFEPHLLPFFFFFAFFCTNGFLFLFLFCLEHFSLRAYFLLYPRSPFPFFIRAKRVSNCYMQEKKNCLS